MKLTAKKCETAKRDVDGAKLSDGGGLYLELHKNGSKYWRYKYRILGKEKVLALGVYRHEVPDAQLAHAKKGDVNRAYDRAKFLEERVIMMQRWADYLDNNARGGTVISGDFAKRKTV